MTEAYGTPEPAVEIGDGHLDLPLARTVRLEALDRRPTAAAIEQLRRDAAVGLVKGGGNVLAEERRWSPARAAVVVGGVFGAVIAVASIITLLVNRDSDMLLPAFVLVAIFVVVPGAIAFVGVGVGRSRRWRRHAQVAAFAAENGLRHALVVPTQSVPRGVVAGTRRHRSVVVADVVAGRVGERALLLGIRTSEEPSGDTTTTRRLMWVALAEQAGGATVRPEAFRERVRDLLGRGRAVVERDDDWLVVGVEHGSAGWDRAAGLLRAVDLVLLGDDGGAAGPSDGDVAPSDRGVRDR